MHKLQCFTLGLNEPELLHMLSCRQVDSSYVGVGRCEEASRICFKCAGKKTHFSQPKTALLDQMMVKLMLLIEGVSRSCFLFWGRLEQRTFLHHRIKDAAAMMLRKAEA